MDPLQQFLSLFTWLKNRVTLGYFQMYGNYRQSGQDMALPYGTDVTSLTSGTVTRAEYNEGGEATGGTVIVKSNPPPGVNAPNGLYTAYIHLGPMNVHVGDIVRQGQLIGQSNGTCSGLGASAPPWTDCGAHLMLGFYTTNYPAWQTSFNPQNVIGALANNSSGNQLLDIQTCILHPELCLGGIIGGGIQQSGVGGILDQAGGILTAIGDVFKNPIRIVLGIGGMFIIMLSLGIAFLGPVAATAARFARALA